MKTHSVITLIPVKSCQTHSIVGYGFPDQDFDLDPQSSYLGTEMLFELHDGEIATGNDGLPRIYINGNPMELTASVNDMPELRSPFDKSVRIHLKRVTHIHADNKSYLNEFTREYWFGNQDRRLAPLYATRDQFNFRHLSGSVNGAACGDYTTLKLIIDNVLADVFADNDAERAPAQAVLNGILSQSL